jgi:hypothetical protein
MGALLPIKPGDVKPSHRLTNLEKQQFSLPDELKQILVGLLLGDLHAQKQSVNTRLVFTQGLIHQEYLMHLYEIFSNYCPSAPKITNPAPDKRTGIVYKTICFNTYSNSLYDLIKLTLYSALESCCSCRARAAPSLDGAIYGRQLFVTLL